jgi:DNA-binding NarL/FixJ family response regulator
VALPSLTVRGVGSHAVFTMNATAHAARTLPVARPLAPVTTRAARRDETENAVRTCYLTARLVDALIETYTLGEAEQQIVNHLLFGRSSKAIAQRLGIRETTVHKHMHRIFAKTKTDNRRELFDFALRLSAQRSFTGRRVRAAA